MLSVWNHCFISKEVVTHPALVVMALFMEFGMGMTEIGQVLEFKLRMRNPFMIVFNFHVLALCPANSSVGRVSDCSSEGRQFEPSLVDIETSLTQLVECQPHELKVVGSIPT